MIKHLIRYLWVFFLATSIPHLVIASDEDPLDPFLVSVGNHIRQSIIDQRSQGRFVCHGELICGIAFIPDFYSDRQFFPAWLDRKGPTAAALSLVHAVTMVAEDGLNLPDYHLDSLQHAIKELPNGQAQHWAELDILLTDTFLLLSTHLSFGRVNPETLHSDWLATHPSFNIISALDRALTQGQSEQVLQSLVPTHDNYKRLRRALAGLRETAASGGWPQIDSGPTLKATMKDLRIPVLRSRLQLSGDLPGNGSVNDDLLFDHCLDGAVRHFQKRHGLAVDGVVGTQTLAALNTTVTKRIRQVELNMERLRWLPRQLGSWYIIVNTAGFYLQCVESNRVVLEMKVVVGRPVRRTPVFSSLMTYLVLNPYWYVPRTIAVNDILPELIEQGAAYLYERKITVLDGWHPAASPLEPDFIDWHQYGEKKWPFQLRQEPGPDNALGRIKFMFPNKFAVYLHDTPNKALFDREKRDFSSGCIRVADAKQLAAYVLKTDATWNEETLMTAIGSGQRQVIKLVQPIPVHLVYLTAWVDENDVLQFRDDIYHRDETLDKALTNWSEKINSGS